MGVVLQSVCSTTQGVVPHSLLGAALCTIQHSVYVTTHCMWYHYQCAVPHSVHSTTSVRGTTLGVKYHNQCAVPHSVHSTTTSAQYHTVCVIPHSADATTFNFVQQTTDNLTVQDYTGLATLPHWGLYPVTAVTAVTAEQTYSVCEPSLCTE